MTGYAANMRYRRRMNHMKSYRRQTESVFDEHADGFNITTSGDLDPTEAVWVPSRGKKNRLSYKEEPPVEDSFTGHYTEAPRRGRVTRANDEPGNDQESGRNWQRREQERELDADTPLDAVFRR